MDAWWTVHSLVKFTETICAGPPVVSSTVHITARWPGVIRDGNLVPSGAKRDTISQFLLAQDFRIEGETPFGLQARASALLGEAHSITAAYHRDPPISQSADFRSRFTTLDNFIHRFLNSLPHPATLSRSSGTGSPYTSRQMVLVINLAALAQISLHRPFALVHAPSNRRCVDSAIRAVEALNGLEDPRVMNPICVVSWGVFFSVLHGELRRLRSQSRPGYGSAPIAQGANEASEADVVNALRSLVAFSGSWSGQYPLQVTIRAKLQAAASST